MILNFGVADRDPNFRLESTAKNIMNFRCPDERGNVPLQTPICQANGGVEQCILTRVCLDEVLVNMQEMYKDSTVVISKSAGEYICNYMYYRALETA